MKQFKSLYNKGMSPWNKNQNVNPLPCKTDVSEDGEASKTYMAGIKMMQDSSVSLVQFHDFIKSLDLTHKHTRQALVGLMASK